jgi:hypothetical protein
MTATFAWLDYSERDRRQALDVVDLLREAATVDELGLGVVRDAFADLLFPGTSTIQTRARYFLFVPWIYLELERLRAPSAEVATRARRAEVALIDARVESGEREGVIGILAGRTLKRLPSNVYWNGLRSWGIRRFPGSQPQYHRALDGFYASPEHLLIDDDRNPAGGTSPTNWDPNLPPPPRGFHKGATLSLTSAEAEYLRERIIVTHRYSMLAFLVQEGEPTKTAFPWEHPQHREFREPFAEEVLHARLFSEAIHGAQLLYNLMLAEAVKNDEWVQRFVEAINDWGVLIGRRQRAFAAWDRRRFWAIVVGGGGQPSTRARDFMDTWFDLALAPSAAARIARVADARRLVAQREHQLKGSRARLLNRQALLLWQGDAGSRQIDFRWGVTQEIANDILEGLPPDA